MSFTETISDFINADTPGYVAATLNGVAVGIIFDNGSDGALSGGMLGTNPIATIATADAVAPRGQTLIVDAVSYTVREAKPDGTGITVLELEKA